MIAPRRRAFVTTAVAAVFLLGSALPAQTSPEWATSLTVGPPLSNGITGMVVDAAGVTYVTGNRGPSSNTDIVTAAWSPAGVLLWSHVFNGAANWHDQARGLALSSTGVLYVTGNTPGPGNYANVLLLAYDPTTGILLRTVQHSGGPFLSEAGASVATDGAGNVYVAGSSSADGLALKFDANGTLQWRQTWDGPAFGPYSQDHARKILVAPDGNPVVLLHGVMGGNQPDYVVVKYAAAGGAPLWQTNWGVPGGDYPHDMEIDAAGDVFVSGIGIDAASNKYSTIKLRGTDGLLLWQAYDLGGFHPSVRGLALDDAGGVYVTGSVDPDGNQSNNNDDFYTVKRDALTGSLVWTHSYGANCLGCLDLPADLVVDAAGNLWLGGSTSSPPYAGTLVVFGIDAATGVEFDRRTVNAGPNRSAGVVVLGLDASQNVLVGGQSRDDNTFDTDILVVKYATAATVRASGAGCSGSGAVPLALATTGVPGIPNPTFAFAITGGPPAVLHAVALALDLAAAPIPFGPAGCSILLDLPTLVALSIAPGGMLPLPIPAAPALRGMRFGAQGLAFDAVTGGIVTSNALAVMLGL